MDTSDSQTASQLIKKWYFELQFCQQTKEKIGYLNREEFNFVFPEKKQGPQKIAVYCETC